MAIDYNCTEHDPWLTKYFARCYEPGSARAGLRNALDKVLARTMQQTLPHLDKTKRQEMQRRFTEAHEETKRLDDTYAELECLTLELMATEQYRSTKLHRSNEEQAANIALAHSAWRCFVSPILSTEEVHFTVKHRDSD